MKISSAFPGKYLKSADLDGRDVAVKIDDVQMETMEQSGGETKPVLYFIGKERGLVLNVTNATTISAVLGDDTEMWHGKEVVLFATTTSFGGRTVPCIRVRVPRQPAEATTARQETANAGSSDAAASADVPF